MERVIGLISANYETGALGTLTSERTIASLPFGGRYRMIDFPLSNMVNSGIQTVGLITPYKYRSVIDHIGAGKEWSLDRKNGGLFILPGTVFGVSSSESRFLLRDLKRNLVYLRRSPAEYVILTSSDVVYNMDYRPMVEKHIESGADITLLYNVAREDFPMATGIGFNGHRVSRITKGVKKGGNTFLVCLVLRRTLLLDIIQWYSAVDHLDLMDAIESELQRLDIRGYRFDGYARGISSTEEYFQYSMELLEGEVRNMLFSRDMPIMTKVQDSVPTKYLNGSRVQNSLIPAGCVIRGTVENSILFRGVTVGEGAVVRNSILMQSCTLEDGAVVENAIIDRGNVISAGTVLKGPADSVFVMSKKLV